MALETIIPLLLQYKYALLFPVAVAEGPIVSILGGFLASSNYLNVYAVFVVVLLGDLVADTIYYLMGRYGGLTMIKKYGRFLRLNDRGVERLQSHFQKHAGKTLFAGKFAHGLGTIVLFSAGIGQVPYPKFMILNLLSAALKSAILVTVGYYYGYAYHRIDDYLSYAAYIFIGVAVVLVFVYYKATRSIRQDMLQ